MDTHQYLDSKSCHPTHVKRGIPYGQALWMRQIYDSDKVFKERLKELEGNLVKRGFKKNLTDEQFFKAKVKRKEDVCRIDFTFMTGFHILDNLFVYFMLLT